MFQTLKGSLQTMIEAGKKYRENYMFQTLKGSLQTRLWGEEIEVVERGFKPSKDLYKQRKEST
ncbi:MAG: hypothetical protein MjAS7_1970 [Metallosphaera javensis (ex Sakai et al. 2022)]|nr:MAG: hypothetical protein MjAS7_1970 [Metallosphaera javensis (ex Sakai et al. 2022)]